MFRFTLPNTYNERHSSATGKYHQIMHENMAVTLLLRHKPLLMPRAHEKFRKTQFSSTPCKWSKIYMKHCSNIPPYVLFACVQECETNSYSAGTEKFCYCNFYLCNGALRAAHQLSSPNLVILLPVFLLYSTFIKLVYHELREDERERERVRKRKRK